MTNNEIVELIVNGINNTPKDKRADKIKRARELITNSTELCERHKNMIWEKVGKRI